MTFWKFQHFNLVSKISQKLFKPLPCHRSIGKMLHAICISAVAVSLRWASCGPWASCLIELRFYSPVNPLGSWRASQFTYHTFTHSGVGWVRQGCHVSYVTGAFDWYWLNIWVRPPVLAAGKDRGGMFIFLLFLHFHSFSFLHCLSLSSPLLSLLCLFSLSVYLPHFYTFWSWLGEARVSCILRHRGVRLILT